MDYLSSFLPVTSAILHDLAGTANDQTAKLYTPWTLQGCSSAITPTPSQPANTVADFATCAATCAGYGNMVMVPQSGGYQCSCANNVVSSQNTTCGIGAYYVYSQPITSSGSTSGGSSGHAASLGCVNPGSWRVPSNVGQSGNPATILDCAVRQILP